MINKNKNRWVWWKHGVIYHIYLLSFYDSNNDGKGDIRGVIEKLDYLENLGIDAIWLSPFFKTPLADFGYDVSDYYSVDPVFGNLDDFKELLNEAHKRNIRVILDMVLNHTSDQHPWFIESRSDKNNPKRDWYIWKSSTGKRKPNNWKTAFGGSCWEFDPFTNEYYLHSFFKEQPDLNWRNREVKKEMFAILRYWLDMGVDGFRLDVINYIVKDKKLRNNPVLFGLLSSGKIRTRNHKKSFKIILNLRKLLDEYPDRMCVGEVYTLPPGDPKLAAKYLSEGNNSLHLTFDFSPFFIRWNAKSFSRTIENWQNIIPVDGWPSIVFSNHDLFRAINRIGMGKNPEQKARLLALILMTVRGTPFIYYGEEIGMKNSNIPWSSVRDPLGKKFWPFFKGRDRARTPMQWDESTFAGFSQVEPWLTINKDYKKNNVFVQNRQPDSLLNLYRELISIRRANPALYAGRWYIICKGKEGLFIYLRKLANDNFLIVTNFNSKSTKLSWYFNPCDRLIFSTVQSANDRKLDRPFCLQAYEGVIFHLQKTPLI